MLKKPNVSHYIRGWNVFLLYKEWNVPKKSGKKMGISNITQKKPDWQQKDYIYK